DDFVLFLRKVNRSLHLSLANSFSSSPSLLRRACQSVSSWQVTNRDGGAVPVARWLICRGREEASMDDESDLLHMLAHLPLRQRRCISGFVTVSPNYPSQMIRL
ncbi:unnamed protein product, partial [Brassica rapa subsp. narinosa]